MYPFVYIVIGLLIIIFTYIYKNKKKETYNKTELSLFQNNLTRFKIESKPFDYPIYYINMDKDTDRKQETENELRKISNNVHRVSGVNGRKIKNIFMDNVDGISFYNEYNRMSLPEMGCLLSHIKAIHTAYNDGNEIALICEDDISVEPYKLTIGLEEMVRLAPVDWEYIQLFSGFGPIINDMDFNSLKFYKYSNKYWSAVCYLVNRKGMKHLLEITGYPYHIKRIFKNFPENGVADDWIPSVLKSYTVSPFFFAIRQVQDSTIHNDHIEAHHLPILYSYLKKVNQYISTKTKSLYIDKPFDVDFVNHIFPGYIRTFDKNNASIIVSNILSKDRDKKALKNQKKIIIDREPNDDSSLKNADLVITTKLYPKHSLKSVYIPCYSISFSEYGLSPSLLTITPKQLPEKTEFCAFVYSNCNTSMNGVKNRERFFDLLQKASGNRVHSWGKCKNNMILENDKGLDYNYKLFSKYKFVIAFENDYLPGYISEKITNPMLAGSIPIYLGAEDVNRHFNHESFINVSDFSSYEKCIDYILRLDTNFQEYLEMFYKPWLIDNKVSEYFFWENTNFEKFI